MGSFDVSISDDATHIVCPGCKGTIISVPKGKTKIGLHGEVVALKHKLKEIRRLGLFDRIFFWKAKFVMTEVDL